MKLFHRHVYTRESIAAATHWPYIAWKCNGCGKRILRYYSSPPSRRTHA